MTFLDYFSSQSVDYATFRPCYPDALFDWMAGQCDELSVAVDCATGNGQAAGGLVRHFRGVVALDPSRSQLHEAPPVSNVEYVRSTAERTPIRTGTVDLVTVAQAIHWFDIDAFFEEIRRILKPRGLVTIWAYGLPRISKEVDALLDDHYGRVLGGYWPQQRSHVDARYRTLDLPLKEIAPPSFDMTTVVTVESVVGYIRSWSATRRYVGEQGVDPFIPRLRELDEAWGSEQTRLANWPMFLRAGQF